MGSRLESKPAKHLTHSLARPRADVIKQVAGSVRSRRLCYPVLPEFFIATAAGFSAYQERGHGLLFAPGFSGVGCLHGPEGRDERQESDYRDENCPMRQNDQNDSDHDYA
jgi:hypothetical protein